MTIDLLIDSGNWMAEAYGLAFTLIGRIAEIKWISAILPVSTGRHLQ